MSDLSTAVAAGVAGTRARLMDATWRCITDGGLAAATSRAITERAEANLGAITYHFGSKDSLIDETLIGAIQRLIGPALEILADESLDPAAGFLAAIKTLQRSLDSQADLAPAYLEALLRSRRSESLERAATSTLSNIRRLLAKRMEQQKVDGFLPPWVEPDVMAGLLLAVTQGVVLQALVDVSGPSQKQMTTQFAQILLSARRP